MSVFSCFQLEDVVAIMRRFKLRDDFYVNHSVIELVQLCVGFELPSQQDKKHLQSLVKLLSQFSVRNSLLISDANRMAVS